MGEMACVTNNVHSLVLSAHASAQDQTFIIRGLLRGHDHNACEVVCGMCVLHLRVGVLTFVHVCLEPMVPLQ